MGDESSPSWMDADKDNDHKAEVEPLFGTGNVGSLQDTEEDEESGKHFGYGAVASKKSEDDDGDDDDNSSEYEKTVITKASSASAKSKPKSKKVRQIVITETGKPEMPRPNCLMASFNLIEGITVITCLALMASQVIPFVFITVEDLGLANACLKVYISLFCVIFIFVEWDIPFGFLRDASFLQAYLSRGFLYSFIGLSALEEAYSERVADMIAHAQDQFRVSWISLFMQISAWTLLGIGAVYMLFGMCCLKALRDKVKRDHRDKWLTYNEAMKVYRETNS